jgi:hypothetical protein
VSKKFSRTQLLRFTANAANLYDPHASSTQLRRLVSFTCRFYGQVKTLSRSHEARLYERRPSGLVAGRRAAATPRPKASDRRVGTRWRTSQEPHREGGARYPVGHVRSRPLSALCYDRKWSAARYEAWPENTLEWLLLR